MAETVLKGRYKLIDERGSGTVATVHVSRDLLTNSIYAVKMLHPALNSDTDAVQRIQREAQILQRISDPHVVQFIDFGLEAERYYLVMEYVDGHTLKQRILTQGQLPPQEAMAIAGQTAAALATTHTLQIVHRDIKPQNMLLSTKAGVKLTDFGAARDSASQPITQSHALLGAPYYISPEHADNSHEVDIRSDLYSLACVLFEALSGHVPFEGSTAMDVIQKQVHEPVPSIRDFQPEFPADFDEFFQQAMAKGPASRFQTPVEFIAALGQLSQAVGTPPGGKLSADEGHMPPAVASHVHGQLIHLSTGQVFLITQPQTLIGRSDVQRGILPEIDLTPMDSGRTVSRRHALILYQQGQFSVQDLNAFNRTRLNRVVLSSDESHPLRDGDTLTIGNHDLRFKMY